VTKQSGICLGVLITSFLSFFLIVPITPVLAFEFSYPEYWFYINEPTYLNHSDICFTVRNNEDFNISVTVSAEQIEGLNVTVYFEWNQVYLSSMESKSNHYSIRVNELFNGSYPLRIILKATCIDNPGVSTSGTVINRLIYYSELEGYLFDLHIVDQSGQPRESYTTIKFKVNDSMSWTTFREFNGTSYQAYFPSGWYEIIAQDLETDIIGKEVIYLDNNTRIDLTLKLVGFDYFEVITDNYLYVGVNSTIDNHVDTLEDVYIYAELFLAGKVISQSTVEYRENLETTTGISMVLWFPFTNWTESVRYGVRGYIYSYGLLVAQEQRYFDSFFTYEKTKKDTTLSNFQIAMIMGICFGLGLSVVIIHDKLANRKYDEIEAELPKTKTIK
jgi:hypothetical protein